MAKITERIFERLMREINNPNIKGFGDKELDARFLKWAKTRKDKVR